MSIKHGYAKAGSARTPEYRSWRGMIDRCKYKGRRSAHRYAGRGIKVCPQWIGEGGFERFLADVGHRPGPGYSIDREDNDKDYEPGNVKWATQREQCSNTERNVFVVIDGRRQVLKAWCRELNMPYKQVGNRIRAGWDPVRALTTPMGPSNEARAAACQ